MRICIYTETALPMIGGQELAIDALARQFQSRGHEVVVLAVRSRGDRDDFPGLPYPVVRHRRYISTRRFLDLYRHSIHAVYRKYRFDVMHCHNVYPAGFVAARWTASHGIPLAVTSHGCDIAPESHLLVKRGVRPRVAYTLANANAAIAINPLLAERFQYLGASADSIVRIPNGVNAAKLAIPVPRPAELPSVVRPGKYFLSMGRMVHRKGFDLLLDAFRRTQESHDLDLLIAGEGNELEALQNQAKDLGLGQRVHFLGVVGGATKDHLLQNSRCAVMPSRISEGSSLVVLESFAAGRPVLGTAIPGLVEAIHPGRNGWLVAEDAVDELSEALATIARDPETARRLGANARQDASEFSWRNIADRHLVVYDRMCLSKQHRIAA